MITATIPTVADEPPVVPMRRRDALLGRHAQFLLYIIIGVGALVIDLSLYAIVALGIGWHPLIAHTISTSAAAIMSFLSNSFVNFKVTDRLLLRALSFGVVIGVGYLVSALIIGVGISVLSMDPLLAKVISLPVVLVLQFTLNKRITFKSTRERTLT